MKKFDYTHYQELLQSFDYEVDSFNPYHESFKQYIEISEKFDPIKCPPKPTEKKDYILNNIVPILQEYSRDFGAILEIEEKTNSITISMIANVIRVIKDNTDFRDIIYYSTSFTIERSENRVILQLYFSTK